MQLIFLKIVPQTNTQKDKHAAEFNSTHWQLISMNQRIHVQYGIHPFLNNDPGRILYCCWNKMIILWLIWKNKRMHVQTWNTPSPTYHDPCNKNNLCRNIYLSDLCLQCTYESVSYYLPRDWIALDLFFGRKALLNSFFIFKGGPYMVQC